MKFTRQHLEGVVLGLALLALVPVVSYAARTAIPLITGLFPTVLNVNVPAPIDAMAVDPRPGSLTPSANALYVEVTALDGVGETIGGPLLGTTTIANSSLQITWPQVIGAFGYRVYFSTSTTQAFTQYFNATTTDRFTMTSTSSPIFIPTGIPATNTAYVVNLSSTGNSWLNGGKIALGTTTIPSSITMSVGSSTATTTTLYGQKGVSGGSFILVDSTAGHTTCSALSVAGGVLTTAVVTCP